MSAAEPEPFDAQVGQIRIARADRGDDLSVLVIEVHDAYVQALLCGDECAFATETDSVLEPSVTGFLPRLLVHGDVSAPILMDRLGGTLGSIGSHLAQRIALRGRGLDFNATDLGRGTAILSETDPRWGWKLAKHKEMRRVRARAAELGWHMFTLGSADGAG